MTSNQKLTENQIEDYAQLKISIKMINKSENEDEIESLINKIYDIALRNPEFISEIPLTEISHKGFKYSFQTFLSLLDLSNDICDVFLDDKVLIFLCDKIHRYLSIKSERNKQIAVQAYDIHSNKNIELNFDLRQDEDEAYNSYSMNLDNKSNISVRWDQDADRKSNSDYINLENKSESKFDSPNNKNMFKISKSNNYGSNQNAELNLYSPLNRDVNKPLNSNDLSSNKNTESESSASQPEVGRNNYTYNDLSSNKNTESESSASQPEVGRNNYTYNDLSSNKNTKSNSYVKRDVIVSMKTDFNNMHLNKESESNSSFIQTEVPRRNSTSSSTFENSRNSKKGHNPKNITDKDSHKPKTNNNFKNQKYNLSTSIDTDSECINLTFNRSRNKKLKIKNFIKNGNYSEKQQNRSASDHTSSGLITDYRIDHTLYIADSKKDHALLKTDNKKDQILSTTDSKKDHALLKTDNKKDHTLYIADSKKDHALLKIDNKKDQILSTTDSKKDHALLKTDNKKDQILSTTDSKKEHTLLKTHNVAVKPSFGYITDYCEGKPISITKKENLKHSRTGKRYNFIITDDESSNNKADENTTQNSSSNNKADEYPTQQNSSSNNKADENTTQNSSSNNKADENTTQNSSSNNKADENPTQLNSSSLNPLTKLNFKKDQESINLIENYQNSLESFHKKNNHYTADIVDFIDNDDIIEIIRIFEKVITQDKDRFVQKKLISIGFFDLLPVITTSESTSLLENLFQNSIFPLTINNKNENITTLLHFYNSEITIYNQETPIYKINFNQKMLFSPPILEILRYKRDPELIQRPKPIIHRRKITSQYTLLTQCDYSCLCDSLIKNYYYFLRESSISNLIKTSNFLITYLFSTNSFLEKQDSLFLNILTTNNIISIIHIFENEFNIDNIKLLKYILIYITYTENIKRKFILAQLLQTNHILTSLITKVIESKELELIFESLQVIARYIQLINIYNGIFLKEINTNDLYKKMLKRQFIAKLIEIITYEGYNKEIFIGLCKNLYFRKKPLFWYPSIFIVMKEVICDYDSTFSKEYIQNFIYFVSTSRNNIAKIFFKNKKIEEIKEEEDSNGNDVDLFEDEYFKDIDSD